MAELDGEGLEALARFLDFAEGQFDLAMVRADTPDARNALEAWLRERVARLDVVDLDLLGTDPLARLREMESLGDVLMLTGLEGRSDEAFRALNVQRDALIDAAPIPWILVGHHQGLTDLQQVAPDFCDLVSAHVTIAAGPEEPTSLRERAWMPINAHSGVYSRIVAIELEAAPREAVDANDAPHARVSALQREGRLAEARELLDRWWISVRRNPSAPPRTLAGGMRLLGMVMLDQGDLAGARRQLEQSLEIYAKVFGTELHPSVAASLHELARVLNAQGDLDGAVARLERVLAIEARVYGTRDHYSTAMTEVNLAQLLLERGERDRALELASHAQRILASVLGPDHEWTRSASSISAASSEIAGAH